MELPEETFVNMHRYDAVGETYGMSHLLFLILKGYLFVLVFLFSKIHEVVSSAAGIST